MLKRRLIVTGFGGFVAGSVVWQVGEAWELHVISRRSVLPSRSGVREWIFDLREERRLAEVFAEIEPHAVIHLAALADIDFCQSHRDEADAINAGVTRHLARLCANSRARLIFGSTDTVFDGGRGMYTENDEPQPVNFYGETKARAEKAVRDEIENSVVARLSLVFGLPVLGSGNSFLAKMRSALSEGREVRVPREEVRSPVDVVTLGRSLLELAGNDFRGTLHLAGDTRINRYDMAWLMAERLGHARELVVPTDAAAMLGRAPRPINVSLDNSLARRVLKTPMQSLAAGLDLVLEVKEKVQHGRPAD